MPGPGGGTAPRGGRPLKGRPGSGVVSGEAVYQNGSASRPESTAARAPGSVAAPVRVLDAAGLPDSGAGLARAGLAGPREVWVIRPDAHAAAVLRDPGEAEIAAALRRALARAGTS